MEDKKQIYDDIYNNPKYKNLTYKQMENVYKNALLNIYDDNLIPVDNIKSKFAYSPKEAVDYAIRFAYEYNPEYPHYSGYGGDCANFISQALHAGGKPMIGYNASSMKNWFCRTRNKWAVDLISSTWRGASAFAYYWSVNANAYEQFSSSYFENLEAFRSIYNYGSRGDAVTLYNKDRKPYHTLIIVDYDKGDLICASHSYDSSARSLLAAAPEGGARIYRMS
ncbi:MAG: amidase domain-containing protein [Clostridium sp.]|uniref:amidase domain-containing protein n=1 Tax=Clostridium sp. TaxID=1506 RepID=UPI002FC885BB